MYMQHEALSFKNRDRNKGFAVFSKTLFWSILVKFRAFLHSLAWQRFYSKSKSLNFLISEYHFECMPSTELDLRNQDNSTWPPQRGQIIGQYNRLIQKHTPQLASIVLRLKVSGTRLCTWMPSHHGHALLKKKKYFIKTAQKDIISVCKGESSTSRGIITSLFLTLQNGQKVALKGFNLLILPWYQMPIPSGHIWFYISWV